MKSRNPAPRCQRELGQVRANGLLVVAPVDNMAPGSSTPHRTAFAHSGAPLGMTARGAVAAVADSYFCPHVAKKKKPVSRAFATMTMRIAHTTDWVVATPTPSAPPSTSRPRWQAMVMMIHAKTTDLISPE